MGNEKGIKNTESSEGVPPPVGNSAQAVGNTENVGGQANNDQGNDGGTSGSSIISPNIQAFIYTGLAIMGTAILLYGLIGKHQIIDRLSSIEHARGLITFILTVGTISIALLVTLGALMGRDKEARDRFYRAKEILTLLIGVLGTIVGFYFGSQESTAGRLELKVATPILSAYNVKSGEPFTLTSFVRGGSPPYRYEISFTDNVIDRLDGYADDSGWVNVTITAPTVDQQKIVSYTLSTTDADGNSAAYNSEKNKHVIVEKN